MGILNVSDNPIPEAPINTYPTYQAVTKKIGGRQMAYWSGVAIVILLGILMLPWTQNVRAKGKLTTLNPDQRPQSIYATIGGRIERWYVREGDFVRKGDTIAFLSEIKAEYFDPKLLERTKQQVEAKSQAAQSYEDKASALEKQIQALREAQKLKLEQANNKILQSELKIITDSMDLEAATLNYNIAAYQLRRTDTLERAGIKSLTDLEEKRNKAQETAAKRISAQNKLLTSRNELLNAKIERDNIINEYADKIAKSQSDRFTAISSIYDAEGSIAKLNNQYSNYEVRSQYYYVIAPQDCYITKILKKGVGEIIKENDELVIIMPSKFDLVVEMYIAPMDYPLLKKGQKVRFIFDGWPAFVFAGWPGQSFGTFGGKIVVIDNMTMENGRYRIMVAPDESDPKKWPDALRVGSAADGMILLNDVPMWYEIWRQLNGFPPDYYDEDREYESVKMKAPAQNLKK